MQVYKYINRVMGIGFDNGIPTLLAVICLMTTGLGTANITTHVWAI